MSNITALSNISTIVRILIRLNEVTIKEVAVSRGAYNNNLVIVKHIHAPIIPFSNNLVISANILPNTKFPTIIPRYPKSIKSSAT